MPTQIVGVSASCYPPLHHEVQKSFLLAAAHAGGRGTSAVRRLLCVGAVVRHMYDCSVA